MDHVNKEKVEHHFSDASKFWNAVYFDEKTTNWFNSFEVRKRREIVLRLFDEYVDKQSLNILDCGCGAGIFLCDFLERGHNLVGIDISETMLCATRENVQSVIDTKGLKNSCNLLLSDIEKLPFADETFDVVNVIGVLQYLNTDKKCISELSRVTKPGGILIVTLPNIAKINNIFDPYYYFELAGILTGKILKKSHTIFGGKTKKKSRKRRNFTDKRYFYRQTDDMFSSQGVRAVKWESVSFGSFTFWKKDILSTQKSMKISNIIKKLSDKKIFSPLNIIANRWVILLRKQ